MAWQPSCALATEQAGGLHRCRRPICSLDVSFCECFISWMFHSWDILFHRWLHHLAKFAVHPCFTWSYLVSACTEWSCTVSRDQREHWTKEALPLATLHL